MSTQPNHDRDEVELRLFLEETCCNICRFIHATPDDRDLASVRIDQEVNLGVAGAFADIRIIPPSEPPYYVEVKFGYSIRRMLRSLARKYGPTTPGAQSASKVVLVVDAERHADWPEVEAAIRQSLRPGLKLEVWNEGTLVKLLRGRLNVAVDSLTGSDLLQVRDAVNRAKVAYAFDGNVTDDPLESALVWHFGHWRLRRLLADAGGDKRQLLRPGLYHNVVVVNADLTSFSSYVRDTPDEQVVRDCLTSFYSKSRYQVIHAGGMLYQFIGDAVIAFFGVPEPDPGDAHLRCAMDCALSLVDIGDSVSSEWQRQIDRVQPGSGVHIGIAVGDLQAMPLMPFSRSHFGAVSDSINMTARLHRGTTSSEILVTNTFYHQLDPDMQSGFEEVGLLEARNVGTIRAWRANLDRLRRGALCTPRHVTERKA